MNELELEETSILVPNAVPLLVSNLGEIICIEKSLDPPRVGIYGRSGSGKTLLLWKAMCGVYCYFEEPCFWANDITSESLYCTEPQNKKSWINKLKFIGERPVILPLVHIYPNNRDLEIDQTDYYYKFALPFESFIRNIENFVDIKRTLPYFKNIVEDILSIENPTAEDIEEIIYNKKSIPKESKAMLSNNITYFIKEKLLDIEEGTIGKVRFLDGKRDEGVYNLIPALAYAGYIPTLMTYSMDGKKYSHKYFAIILKDIFNKQIKSFSDKYEKIFHNFIDEISYLTTNDERTECSDILDELLIRGRPKRTATWYTTQHPSKLPKAIKTNTKFVICLGNDEDEIKSVKKNFNFSKREIRDIVGLGKYEVIAKSAGDEKWLIIDPITGEKTRRGGTIRGKILFPNCSTKPPRREGLINV